MLLELHMNSSQRYCYKPHKAIIFALGFLLAQSVSVFAEFEHPLHKADSTCNVCLAADHLFNGLLGANQITLPFFHHAFADHFHVYPIVSSSTASYNIRAPPLL